MRTQQKEHRTGRCRGGRRMMSEQCRQAKETRGFFYVNTVCIFLRKKDVILLNWSFLKTKSLSSFSVTYLAHKNDCVLKTDNPKHVVQLQFTSLYILKIPSSYAYTPEDIQAWLNTDSAQWMLTLCIDWCKSLPASLSRLALQTTAYITYGFRDTSVGYLLNSSGLQR